MNIFISGGAGFVGSHLLCLLLKDEKVSRLVIFDNFTSGSRSCLDGNRGDSRLRIVEADLKDLGAVKTAMEGCETIYHLAANPDIAKAVTLPDIDFWEGAYLTQNVLEQLRVRNPWFTRIYRTLSPLLPRALHRASFTVNIGEMLVFAQPQMDAGEDTLSAKSAPRISDA
jgi:dTDP-D-glucose 4,6-dehydratase